MIEKIRLPKDVLWRWCCFLALACLLSYLVGQIGEPEIQYVDMETKWCLDQVLVDMKDYHSQNVSGSGGHFISFKGDDVWVFSPHPCD